MLNPITQGETRVWRSGPQAAALPVPADVDAARFLAAPTLRHYCCGSDDGPKGPRPFVRLTLAVGRFFHGIERAGRFISGATPATVMIMAGVGAAVGLVALPVGGTVAGVALGGQLVAGSIAAKAIGGMIGVAAGTIANTAVGGLPVAVGATSGGVIGAVVPNVIGAPLIVAGRLGQKMVGYKPSQDPRRGPRL